jgi:hypothetical protein
VTVLAAWPRLTKKVRENARVPADLSTTRRRRDGLT